MSMTAALRDGAELVSGPDASHELKWKLVECFGDFFLVLIP